jgi:hypothetical protein
MEANIVPPPPGSRLGPHLACQPANPYCTGKGQASRGTFPHTMAHLLGQSHSAHPLETTQWPFIAHHWPGQRTQRPLLYILLQPPHWWGPQATGVRGLLSASPRGLDACVHAQPHSESLGPATSTQQGALPGQLLCQECLLWTLG